MLSTQSELVWKGRIHLGDEPGVYGDASYSGLALELPLTLRKINPAGPNSTTLELQTENLETFAGYPGHLITVTAYKPTPSDPAHAIETVLTTALFTGADANNKSIVLNLSGIPSPIFASVRLRVDTTVPPGLYDDFVLTKLGEPVALHGERCPGHSAARLRPQPCPGSNSLSKAGPASTRGHA